MLRFAAIVLLALPGIAAGDEPENPFAAAEERVYSAVADMVLASQAVEKSSSLFMEGYLKTDQGTRPLWRLYVQHPKLEYHAGCWWQKAQNQQLENKPPGFNRIPIEGQLALHQWATEPVRLWTELAHDSEGWRSRMFRIGSPSAWERPSEDQTPLEFVKSAEQPPWLRLFETIFGAKEYHWPAQKLRPESPLDWFQQRKLIAAEPGLGGRLVTTWRRDISSTQTAQQAGKTVEVTTRSLIDTRVVFDPAQGDMPVEIQLQPKEPRWYLDNSRAIIRWQKVGDHWLPARVRFINEIDLYGPDNTASDRSSTSEFLYHWLIGDDVPDTFYDSEQETRAVMLTHYERPHGDSGTYRTVEISPKGLAREANRQRLPPMKIPEELAKPLE